MGLPWSKWCWMIIITGLQPPCCEQHESVPVSTTKNSRIAVQISAANSLLDFTFLSFLALSRNVPFTKITWLKIQKYRNHACRPIWWDSMNLQRQFEKLADFSYLQHHRARCCKHFRANNRWRTAARGEKGCKPLARLRLFVLKVYNSTFFRQYWPEMYLCRIQDESYIKI